MAQEYFVLSNYGTHYFLLPYTDSDTPPTSATAADEITSVMSADIGAFTKENTKYRTLTGNGWELVAPLGNTAEDGSFECIREGTGNPFVGTAQGSSYNKIKNWFMKATAGAGEASPMCLVEVLPRGETNSYEGVCYFVIPNQWTPGTRDTETGQEYSFTVSVFGPQIPLTVRFTPAGDPTPEEDTWNFTKAAVT